MTRVSDRLARRLALNRPPAPAILRVRKGSLPHEAVSPARDRVKTALRNQPDFSR